MQHSGAVAFDAKVGLCLLCLHVRTIQSGKGSMFWLCERSKDDARFRKYPALPVVRCDGFERPLTASE